MIHANLQRLCGVSMQKIYGIGKLNQTSFPAHQSQLVFFTTEILFAFPSPCRIQKTCMHFVIVVAF